MTKMKSSLLFVALSLSSLISQACSFPPGYERFSPSIATFSAKLDRGRVALLPAPTVSRVQVTRGSAAVGSSCDDAGTLTVQLTWPNSSQYKLGEIGFYFRILRGRMPDQIFPLEPITGSIVGNNAEFVFVWLDGHPSTHVPLRLEVEVFAINRGLQIGKARRFWITVP